MTLVRTHTHTQRNPEYQDFIELISVPNSVLFGLNSNKRHPKHVEGRSLVHALITLSRPAYRRERTLESLSE